MTDRADPLDKLQALGDEATPADWSMFLQYSDGKDTVNLGVMAFPDDTNQCGDITCGHLSEGDALFIAVSRNVHEERLSVERAAAAATQSWMFESGSVHVDRMIELRDALDALYARIEEVTG